MASTYTVIYWCSSSGRYQAATVIAQSTEDAEEVFDYAYEGAVRTVLRGDYSLTKRRRRPETKSESLPVR